MVNIHLDKPVHDVSNFSQFVGEVNEAAEKIGVEVHTQVPQQSSIVINNGSSGTSPLKVDRSYIPETVKPRFMAPAGVVPGYGGTLLAYGIEVGIDSIAPSIPMPAGSPVGTRSLLNIVAAVGFAALGYHQRNHRPMISALSFTSSGHHLTKVIDLARGTGGLTQFVAARPAPMQYTGNISMTSYQPKGVAIF
jgi:hypothetical protein